MNKEAWDKSSERLKCNRTHGYHCVPNSQLTSLVEFCYPRGRTILFQEGNCLELAGSGILNHFPCKQIFSSGCPDSFYYGNQIYKYPKCLAINTTLRCFDYDLQCINSRLAENKLLEQSSTTEPTAKPTKNDLNDSILQLIEQSTAIQNSTFEATANLTEKFFPEVLLIENKTFYENGIIDAMTSLTNSESSIVGYIVLAILLFVTAVLLILVILKRDTMKHGVLKCLRKCKLGHRDTNKRYRKQNIRERSSLLISNIGHRRPMPSPPLEIIHLNNRNLPTDEYNEHEEYYSEAVNDDEPLPPQEVYDEFSFGNEPYLEPQGKHLNMREKKLPSVSDDGTTFEEYLNENQLKVVKSSIDQTDENTGADSNQMHATENSNNIHLEHTNTPYDDDSIYDMEPQSKVGNVESFTDHLNEKTSVNSKTIQIPDDSHNNHPEHSSTPFNKELSNNPDEIEPKLKPRLRYVEVVIDKPNEKPGADSNKIQITIDSQNNPPKHDDTSYSPDEIDPQHETNCNHCHPLPQEHSVQEKDLNRYHHDVHADDGKHTLKNNIQPHPSNDPNNDHTEQTNEENSSVPIEDTFEIVEKGMAEDIKLEDGPGGCVIA